MIRIPFASRDRHVPRIHQSYPALAQALYERGQFEVISGVYTQYINMVVFHVAGDSPCGKQKREPGRTLYIQIPLTFQGFAQITPLMRHGVYGVASRTQLRNDLEHVELQAAARVGQAEFQDSELFGRSPGCDIVHISICPADPRSTHRLIVSVAGGKLDNRACGGSRSVRGCQTSGSWLGSILVHSVARYDTRQSRDLFASVARRVMDLGNALDAPPWSLKTHPPGYVLQSGRDQCQPSQACLRVKPHFQNL